MRALIDFELDPAGRHEMIPVAPIGIVELMAANGLHVDSMGRPAAADPVLFEAGRRGRRRPRAAVVCRDARRAFAG